MSAPTDTDAVPAAAAEPLPLTDSQKGLLVVNDRVPTPEIYNQVMRFDIDPAFGFEAVADALITLVTVQPSMRQIFALRPAPHARFAEPPARAELPLELVEAPADRFDQTIGEWAVRLGRPAFALTEESPWRAGYVRAADGSQAAILLVMHHIIGDGVSLGPVVRDMESALGGSLTAERTRELRATRERAFLRELRAQNSVTTADKTVERARQWAERLREVPAQVLFPRPNRPAETDFDGARLEWLLGEAESDAVAATCKRLNVTPFVLFSALYSAVVARHAAVETVLVGSPFMARRTVGAFDLCGFFVNTLPVAIDVDWTLPFDRHAGEVVREAVDYCRSNVDVPFNQLVAHAQPDRSTNRNPLFACMLAMQDTFDGDSSGVIRGVGEPSNGTAKFDLWLGATPVDGRWLLELEYDTQLIAPVVADGLLTSLRSALRRAVEDGSRTLADLFTDASAVDSRRTDGYPADVPAATLTEWLSDVAAAQPEAVAIADEGGNVSYGELAARVDAVAAGLAKAGVAVGDVVGMCLDTLSDTTVTLLAIMRCGAAYLPLDLSLPAERLRYMAETAGIHVTVGAEVDIPGVRRVTLDELGAGGAELPPLTGAAPPAYVMFTSGSTGRPKGVLMGQGPLLNLTGWQIAALGMDRDTRFLQYAPLGFDVSFQEIVPTLAAGGTVVSREPVDRRDFPGLVRHVADAEVTHIYLPVAALRPFVQAAQARGTRFTALRYVCVSGEQLLVDEQIRAFFVDHPHCELVNLYGPTETHAVTTQRLSGAEEQWAGHVPIGLPLAGVHAYVVDVTGHLAPAGVPGELFLGGRCPAEGYINDRERTAASFVEDRFAGTGSMYRTGDRVLRDQHGRLVFLGRGDTQIKIRGYRVELGEIEIATTDLPEVRQAVVAVRGTGADRELLLFVVPEGDATVDGERVRRHLAGVLPAYMVPARVLTVDTVPTTGTGKTDRDALLARADRLIAERQDAAGPAPAEYADDLERGLAAVWEEVLGATGIERDRTLLDYGAHSLNILSALALVEERFGAAVPIVDFFRLPTIAALAGLVREYGEEEATS
ncbi:non-ribosomal peptide synthetase [Streptomyces sp. NPDC004788]